MSRRGRGVGAFCVAVLAISACSRRSDHELLGDRRYAERAWIDAVAEYRLALRQRPSSELRAKLGTAAIHAGVLEDAAAAFTELGRTDPASAAEASEGLLRTARAASAGRDIAALKAAMLGLKEIAPTRLVELGGELSAGVDDRHGDLDLVFIAAAASPGSLADSLLVLWADGTSRAGHCDQASRVYDGLSRRLSTPVVARAALNGLAGCRVDAGRASLAAGQLDSAMAQFRAAIAVGTPDSTVRLAYVLLGDASWANGDTTVAVESYRKAIVGADEDNPIVQRAREQLQKLTGTSENP